MSKNNYETFFNLYLRGDVLLEEIDDYIDNWHDSDLECSIFDYLGMTEQEYLLWVDDDSYLFYIFEAKIKGISLEEMIDFYRNSTPLVARSNINELKKLREWLIKTGRI